MPNREIADKENVAPSTVSRITTRYGKNHQFNTKKPKPGRPTKMSEKDIRFACRMISTSKAKNATDLKRKFFPSIHVDTLRRALKSRNLKAYIRQKKPLLTAAHRRKRKEWGESHCYWEEKDWRAVIFSDESKFNLIGSDGRQWCWREPGQGCDSRFTKKTVKHGGGSVMVWGCVTPRGVGQLQRIHGIMDRFVYCDILSQSLLGTLDKLDLDRSSLYFQQDGDRKHTAAYTMGWLEDRGFDVLGWCPNSPDMNIIENLWDHLDRMVRARDPLPRNLDELWEALKEEWENIDQGYIDSLYASMPNRVRQLLKANGGETRY